MSLPERVLWFPNTLLIKTLSLIRYHTRRSLPLNSAIVFHVFHHRLQHLYYNRDPSDLHESHVCQCCAQVQPYHHVSTINTYVVDVVFSSTSGTTCFCSTRVILASSSGTQGALAAFVFHATTIEPTMADAPLQAPFHFAHLLNVKLSPNNYLYWRAQMLPLLRSHYL